jgi:hypothetical protein
MSRGGALTDCGRSAKGKRPALWHVAAETSGCKVQPDVIRRRNLVNGGCTVAKKKAAKKTAKKGTKKAGKK